MKENDLFLVPFEENSDSILHHIPKAKYEKWEIHILGLISPEPLRYHWAENRGERRNSTEKTVQTEGIRN